MQSVPCTQIFFTCTCTDNTNISDFSWQNPLFLHVAEKLKRSHALGMLDLDRYHGTPCEHVPHYHSIKHFHCKSNIVTFSKHANKSRTDSYTIILLHIE
ncbi:hypothetical protein GOP47_0007706 [Adiantum capillus-veneris]|uniref:Uncharacterized protein n=1 Tax=Adiantum capillus-veneris TaxID=13818 RepID=A0A9D4V233_ADICA|nr:hypothetical protein GOP47_0007706 [Adiantum capillus-veneris]